ncbi:hypothetical protein AV274_3430, partial [Blastocystis sp. ATCC 50177/Nand II]
MMLGTELNNFLSFGVFSLENQADITLTINNKIALNISAKGVPMLTVSLSHIAGFVQSILNPSSLTIYYKKYFSLLCYTRSTYLPQFYQASSPRICNLIVKILNEYIQSNKVTLADCFKEGPAEKQGKHFWAPRYLVLSGSRLLVFRYSLTQKKGDENLPLNVIDLTNALVTPATPLVISLQTHREYTFRFPSAE